MFENKPKYNQIILKLLSSQPTKWFMSWELTKASTPFGWLGTSGDRIARDMATKGIIERFGREQGSGKYAMYRMKQEQLSNLSLKL